MNKNKFLITQSLLSSWGWLYKMDEGYGDFIKTLNREPITPNRAMLDGQHFENMVTAYCGGAELDTNHEWAKGIKSVGDVVMDGVFQVRLSKNTIVNNVEFVLYGILDVLKCGVIHDIKFSKKYCYGKYLDSPQHPMYFELCPEANKFNYVIFNGNDTFEETYHCNDIEPIEHEIKAFMNFLDKYNLVNLYCEKWRSKY